MSLLMSYRGMLGPFFSLPEFYERRGVILFVKLRLSAVINELKRAVLRELNGGHVLGGNKMMQF